MTDEQRLRAALQDAVPEPPPHTGRGASARLRARRNRRRRLVAAGAVVLVLAAAVPLVHALDTGDTDHQALSGAVTGQGSAACKQLDGRNGLGSSVDSRTVNGSTAATWLRSTHSSIDPGLFSPADSVTVCVMYTTLTYAVVVVGPGHRPLLDSKGDYRAVGAVMQPLDQLSKSGAPTTDAPFTCSRRSTDHPVAVSSALPSGAVAARLCYRGGTMFTPRQVLTTSVDSLVRAIDRSPIVYKLPNISCGGSPDSYDYTMVFEYPSGTRTIHEETCRGIAIGPFTRDVPAPALDQRYLALLQQQTDTSTQGPSRHRARPRNTTPHRGWGICVTSWLPGSAQADPPATAASLPRTRWPRCGPGGPAYSQASLRSRAPVVARPQAGRTWP